MLGCDVDMKFIYLVFRIPPIASNHHNNLITSDLVKSKHDMVYVGIVLCNRLDHDLFVASRVARPFILESARGALRGCALVRVKVAIRSNNEKGHDLCSICGTDQLRDGAASVALVSADP